MPLNYIYQISCKDQLITDTYIGSTNDIRRRTRGHKYHCDNERSTHYNLRVYKFIRAHGGWKNWYVTVLLEFQCETKMEKNSKGTLFH